MNKYLVSKKVGVQKSEKLQNLEKYKKKSEKIGKFQKKYVNFRKKWKNCLKKGILFFKPKIFTSRSLKCHEIPPVVLLSTVLLKTILRVLVISTLQFQTLKKLP